MLERSCFLLIPGLLLCAASLKAGVKKEPLVSASSERDGNGLYWSAWSGRFA